MEIARQILAEGFRNGRGTYMTDEEFEGVWVSDRPLDPNEGAFGNAVLEIEISLPRAVLDLYEWTEEGPKDYREWLLPAALLNGTEASTRLIDGRAV